MILPILGQHSIAYRQTDAVLEQNTTGPRRRRLDLIPLDTMRTRVLFALAICAVVPLAAQLVPPNDAGVTMGHVHLYVKSVDAQTRFWTNIMGGKAVANEKLAMIQFPGVFLIFREMDPSGPPAGSIVDHFGFVVKDLPAA